MYSVSRQRLSYANKWSELYSPKPEIEVRNLTKVGRPPSGFIKELPPHQCPWPRLTYQVNTQAVHIEILGLYITKMAALGVDQFEVAIGHHCVGMGL